MLRALPVLRLAYLRLGMLTRVRSHAVLRHAALGVHSYISLLHDLGWAPFKVYVPGFWLKALLALKVGFTNVTLTPCVCVCASCIPGLGFGCG